MAHTIQLLFHSLRLKDTLVCVINLPKDKISPELDTKILSYVDTCVRSSSPATCILSVSQDVLLQTCPSSIQDTTKSVVYMLDFPLHYFEVDPSLEGMCTLVILPGKSDTPRDTEDIVSVVFKKFVVIVLFLMFLAMIASFKYPGPEL